MSKLKTYWGDEVPNQKMLNERHCALYGRAPDIGNILSNYDLDGAVVFDGETWRELDLVAMQESFNHK